MLISKRTQCTLHLPSHLSEVHAAQPQKTRENNFPRFSPLPPPPNHPHSFALAPFYVLFGFAGKTPGETLLPVPLYVCMCVLPSVPFCLIRKSSVGRGGYGRETRETKQTRDMTGTRRGKTENMKRSPTVYSCNLCSLPRVRFWRRTERFIVERGERNKEREKHSTKGRHCRPPKPYTTPLKPSLSSVHTLRAFLSSPLRWKEWM